MSRRLRPGEVGYPRDAKALVRAGVLTREERHELVALHRLLLSAETRARSRPPAPPFEPTHHANSEQRVSELAEEIAAEWKQRAWFVESDHPMMANACRLEARIRLFHRHLDELGLFEGRELRGGFERLERWEKDLRETLRTLGLDSEEQLRWQRERFAEELGGILASRIRPFLDELELTDEPRVRGAVERWLMRCEEPIDDVEAGHGDERGEG